MSNDYFSYVTNVGVEKIEAAYNAGETINLIEMAIGDSNGAYVEPDASFTALVNEFARVALNDASIDGHLIHVISYIKPTAETAEKTLREYGIYDDEGDMIIYGAYPESLIPSLDSAEYLQLEVENITELENADVVNVTVSPIVPYATETEAGIAKIVNDGDVEAGVDDSKILTISKMLKRVATSVKAGVARFATSAEAINGTDTSTMLNPSAGLALLKSRISGALDGTRTDYTASEYALSQINTKASNAQNTADNAVNLANAAQETADNATDLANAAQDALDAFKAEGNPFPQYLHNDEHATQAQAEEGTSAGVWMSPLRTAQHFLSKLSDKIDGTSHVLAASEYALGLVNKKAEDAYSESNPPPSSAALIVSIYESATEDFEEEIALSKPLSDFSAVIVTALIRSDTSAYTSSVTIPTDMWLVDIDNTLEPLKRWAIGDGNDKDRWVYINMWRHSDTQIHCSTSNDTLTGVRILAIHGM
ncbi:phage tail protein [Vibrio parahaemolyticus]|nr:phage tail protein [Vibrio parahaemolyticus]